MGERGRSDWALLRRVLAEARSHRRLLLTVLLLDLLGIPLTLLNPVPVKIAVDNVLGDQPLPGPLQPLFAPFGRSSVGSVLAVSVLLLVIVLASQLQKLVGYQLRVRAGERVTLAFQVKMFGHAERLSLAYHDLRGTSDALYRIQYDAYAVWNLALDKSISLSTSLIMLLAMLLVTARIQWQLAVVALVVVPVLVWLAQSYKSRSASWYAESKELQSAALQVVQEVLSTLRVVKAFGRERFEEQRLEQRGSQGMRSRVRLALAESAYDGLNNVTFAMGTAAVLFIGMRSVQLGTMTLGSLLLVLAYLGELYGPMQEVTQEVGSLQSSLVSARRAFELLDLQPDVPELPGARPLERASGKLEFRDVSFSYDQRHTVLHDVSFAVEPGTRLGLAGPTGAGKTTLVSLALRFYDPGAGGVLLDGVDLREYRLADLRAQFAMVLQDAVLFSGSVEDNIRYARPAASFEEVVAAAKAANAHDFIRQLPNGYRTAVGERGMRLSGGERQRIALARAFLKDAPILILDEPTSSIDLETEALILEAMDRLVVGRTVIMIAHRLNTLDLCDARIVLEAGRVVSASGAVAAVP